MADFAGETFFVLLIAPFVGSFLGVLILRLPQGKPIVQGRSRCPHCDDVLASRDLVPVISWVLNRGRCRKCRAALGLFYPGIELAALFIAAWAATVLSGPLLWVSCYLGWTLLALALIDWRHQILPNEITLPLIPIGLVAIYFFNVSIFWLNVVGAFVGFAFIIGLRQLYFVIRKREGIGLGDAKLMAAAGAWVSLIGLPSVLLIGALGGLAAVLVGSLGGRSITASQRIPFGTFLCSGIWLTWLYGPLVVQ